MLCGSQRVYPSIREFPAEMSNKQVGGKLRGKKTKTLIVDNLNCRKWAKIRGNSLGSQHDFELAKMSDGASTITCASVAAAVRTKHSHNPIVSCTNKPFSPPLLECYPFCTVIPVEPCPASQLQHLITSSHPDSQVSSKLVESAGQGHHLVSSPADDRDTEHGLKLTTQHALQLLHILLQRGGESGEYAFFSQPSTLLCDRKF